MEDYRKVKFTKQEYEVQDYSQFLFFLNEEQFFFHTDNHAYYVLPLFLMSRRADRVAARTSDMYRGEDKGGVTED